MGFSLSIVILIPPDPRRKAVAEWGKEAPLELKPWSDIIDTKAQFVKGGPWITLKAWRKANPIKKDDPTKGIEYKGSF